jgi:diketogulonate reductase-like aldo/keto reductase
MAAKYQTGLPQIVFRFSQQIGMLPLTGTTNPDHMKEDLASDRFTLTEDELQRIETIGL